MRGGGVSGGGGRGSGGGGALIRIGAGIGIVKVELTFFVVISENLTNDSVIIMK